MNTSSTSNSGYVSTEFAPQLVYFNTIQSIWTQTLKKDLFVGNQKFHQIVGESFHQELPIADCIKRLLNEID